MNTRSGVSTVCVGTVVVQESRVLLVRQPRGHPLEGQWTVPRGIVDKDEAPEDAAVRETLEEAGVLVKIDGLLGLQNFARPGWIGLLFLCHHVDGTPHDDGGAETDAVAWFSLEQLSTLIEPIEPLSAWITQRVLQGTHHYVPPQPQNPFEPQRAFF